MTRVKSTVPSPYWATTILTALSASSTLAAWNFAALLGLQEVHQAVLDPLGGGEDRALVSRHELLKPGVLEPNGVQVPVAQYESWKLPLAVILVVPMCLLCSVVGVRWPRMDVTIFTQIGFVVLVGLASKNAILIVEFAKQRQEAGVPPREATLEACRLRLRPILMTSFAFIFGVVPLVLAAGAGAEMRRSLGPAVFAACSA